MSRIIKFRGLSSDSGKWIYGYLNKPFEDLTQIIENTKSNASQMSLIENDTEGQFTGFIDVNGKEIYEGDIVRSIKGFYSSKIAEVVWMEKRCAFYFISNGCGTDIVNRNPHQSAYKINSYKVEVIGNIHETPYLLQSS
jgi:uncharacterized phage protein (TIGR01671 family)